MILAVKSDPKKEVFLIRLRDLDMSTSAYRLLSYFPTLH